MSHPNRSKRALALLMLLIAALLVSSCSSFSIVNKSSQNVQVSLLIPPFESTKFITIPPGGEDFELGALGGFFDVEVISGTEVVDSLTDFKTMLTAALNQPNLDVADVVLLLDKLDSVTRQLEAAKAAQSENYCSGLVPDFGSVAGTIVDTAKGGTDFSECTINEPTSSDDSSSQ
jgi:hypothetical protein